MVHGFVHRQRFWRKRQNNARDQGAYDLPAARFLEAAIATVVADATPNATLELLTLAGPRVLRCLTPDRVGFPVTSAILAGDGQHRPDLGRALATLIGR